jgi:hypothetical protein
MSMVARRLVLLIILLSTACSTRHLADPTTAVKLRERQWLDAYEQRDATVMSEILHENFVITFPDGTTQSREDVLRYIRGAAGKSSPRFHTENTTTHVSPGVVVLRGIVVTEKGSSKSEQYYTDTYVLERGVWKVLASQLATVAKPQPAG